MSLVDEEDRARKGQPSATSAPFGVPPATSADGEGVAALFVQCVGGLVEEHRQGFERELASARANHLVLVAEAESEIIGFARARHFEDPPPSSADAAPAGWYLLGVVVLRLDALAARCEAGGHHVQFEDQLPGFRRFYVSDPFGNRVEFLEVDVEPSSA